MLRRFRIPRRKLKRRVRISHRRSPLQWFKNKAREHDDNKLDRLMASWGALSAKLVRIITKVVNRIQARLRQGLPQRELEQIVQHALAARYPEAYYRLRSDHPSPSVGTYLPYNVSVVDVGSARDSLWRCAYDLCIDNLCSSRSITLAVVSKPVYSQDDTRSDWRTGGNELKVMNPDMLTDSSSDGETEKLPSCPGVGRPTVERSVGKAHLQIYERCEELFHPDSDSGSGSDSDTDTDPDSLVVGELSALCTLNDRLMSELSIECHEFALSDKTSITSQNRVSLPLIDVPRLPVLLFIEQPDPPLCCLITAALRGSDSSILGESTWFSCLCATDIHDITHDNSMAGSFTPPPCSPGTNNRLLEHEFARAYRKRNSFLLSKVTGSKHLPPPLTLSKDYALSHKIRYGPLPPLPGCEAEKPCHPQDKKTHGALPLIPSPSQFTLAQELQFAEQCMEIPPLVSASTISQSTLLTPGSPKELCSACLDIRGRRRALNSHSLNIPIEQPPYPVTPEGYLSSFDPTDLPTPLRAGERCAHCRNTWAGMISTPDLLSPQVSSCHCELPPCTPEMSRASTSYDEDAILQEYFSEEQLYFKDVLLTELTACIGVGVSARNRRYVQRGFF